MGKFVVASKGQSMAGFKAFRSAACAFLFLIGTGVTPAVFGQAYTVTDLGAGDARAINNAGQ